MRERKKQIDKGRGDEKERTDGKRIQGPERRREWRERRERERERERKKERGIDGRREQERKRQAQTNSTGF